MLQAGRHVVYEHADTRSREIIDTLTQGTATLMSI